MSKYYLLYLLLPFTKFYDFFKYRILKKEYKWSNLDELMWPIVYKQLYKEWPKRGVKR